MFMLDTDSCSYVLKTKSAKLAERFEAETGKIAISEIVLAELRFGADCYDWTLCLGPLPLLMANCEPN